MCFSTQEHLDDQHPLALARCRDIPVTPDELACWSGAQGPEEMFCDLLLLQLARGQWTHRAEVDDA